MSIFGSRSQFPFGIVFNSHYEQRKKLIVWPDDCTVEAIQLGDLCLLTLNSVTSILPIPPRRLNILNLLKTNVCLIAVKSVMPAIPVSVSNKTKLDQSFFDSIKDYKDTISGHLKFAGQAIDYHIKITIPDVKGHQSDILRNSAYEHVMRSLKKTSMSLSPIIENLETGNVPALINLYAAVNIGDETELFNALNELDRDFGEKLNISVRGPEPGWSLGALTEFESEVQKLWITPLTSGQNNNLPGIALQKKSNKPTERSDHEAAA